MKTARSPPRPKSVLASLGAAAATVALFFLSLILMGPNHTAQVKKKVFGPKKGVPAHTLKHPLTDQLCEESANGNIVAIERLLKEKADINGRDSQYVTPMFRDLVITFPRGLAPVFHSVMGNQKIATGVLAKAGANMDVRDNSGYSCLMWSESPEMNRILIESGMSLSISNCLLLLQAATWMLLILYDPFFFQIRVIQNPCFFGVSVIPILRDGGAPTLL